MCAVLVLIGSFVSIFLYKAFEGGFLELVFFSFQFQILEGMQGNFSLYLWQKCHVSTIFA